MPSLFPLKVVAYYEIKGQVESSIPNFCYQSHWTWNTKNWNSVLPNSQELLATEDKKEPQKYKSNILLNFHPPGTCCAES